MRPEYTPPRGLWDPFVERGRVDRATWSRAIRGRFQKLSDVAVARTLADYGNRDGSNCHPGVARLAKDLCTTDKTIKRALGWLAEYGWITLKNRGRRKLGEADVYSLTIPAPVAVEMGMWREDEHGPQWKERPRGEPKRSGLRDTYVPKNVRFLGDTGDPKNEVLGDIGEFLGDKPSVLGDTGVPPPGPLHPVLSHHSALRERPHAGARGSAIDVADLDPDDPDLVERIEERLEEELGGPPNAGTCSLILGMVERQAHPRAIVNAALDAESRTA